MIINETFTPRQTEKSVLYLFEGPYKFEFLEKVSLVKNTKPTLTLLTNSEYYIYCQLVRSFFMPSPVLS